MVQRYYKLDLHTHSILSKDGNIREVAYRQVVDIQVIDYIAVTDHNTIALALALQQMIGERVIVGEEIRTQSGEIIGLFLQKEIPPLLSLAGTIHRIKEQGGLVYLPHPFSHNRAGAAAHLSKELLDLVDIVEHFNPRNIVHSDNTAAEDFANTHKKPKAASSDAHCIREIGRTYSLIRQAPTAKNLVKLLADASYTCSYTPLMHLLCPKKNTLIKKLGIQ